MKKGNSRDAFTGKLGFILACIGSAVGMGNIWLFPRRVAAFGAPFLVAYLICVVVIGLSGVIGEMAFGRVISIIFFVAVLFAGLSSLINLFEAPIEAVQSRLGLKRVPAVSVVLGLGTLIAVFISDIVSDWMDVCSIYICPIGALLAAVMFFWVCGEDFAAKEIESGGRLGCGRMYAKLGKYVFCSLSILVLVVGSLTPGGIG